MVMLKLCRCGKKISVGTLRCPMCQATYDEDRKDRYKAYDKTKRDKTTASFYNSRPWTVTRKRIAERDHHLCRLCLSEKRFKPVEVVHHIKELRDYPQLSLVESNLISLCDDCHKHVHKKYKSSRKEMEKILKDMVGGIG